MRQPAPAPGATLAPTPPMGWNSWNQFGPSVDEVLVRETADALVDTGLAELGYRIVALDDNWHGGRDARDRLFPHPDRFPGGMQALAEYLHSRGLRFGIYACAGERTCAGEPGSYGHEEVDAQTFAAWGVDFLKYDYCHAPEDYRQAIDRFAAMGRALRATGRPIVYSICEWGPRAPWLWARRLGGHLWRVSFDVKEVWDTPRDTNRGIGILTAIDRMTGLEAHAGPGGRNDPDMLVVGLHGRGRVSRGRACTADEYRTQMGMWSLLSAPLFLGCDVRAMDAQTREILGNPEVVAVDQDPLGLQAVRAVRVGACEVWRKPLADGALALGLLNRGEAPAEITAPWTALDLDPHAECRVRDLWAREDAGAAREALSRTVVPHACALLRLAPT